MKSSSSSLNYIQGADVRDNDVIFGRGQGPRSRPGNRRFLELARRHRPEYISYSMEQWREKKIVASKIYNAIIELDPPGRFLTEAKVASKKKTWEILEEPVVIPKIQQSLRDCNDGGKAGTRRKPGLKRGSKVVSSVGDLHTTSLLWQYQKAPCQQSGLFRGLAPLSSMPQESWSSHRENLGSMPISAALTDGPSATSPSVSRTETSLRNIDLTLFEIIERDIQLGRRYADLGHQMRLQSYQHVLRQHTGEPRNAEGANPACVVQQLEGYRPSPYLDLAQRPVITQVHGSNQVPSHQQRDPYHDMERPGESGGFLNEISILAGQTAESIQRFTSENLANFQKSWNMRWEDVPDDPRRNAIRNDSDVPDTRTAASNRKPTGTTALTRPSSEIEQNLTSPPMGTGPLPATTITESQTDSDMPDTRTAASNRQSTTAATRSRLAPEIEQNLTLPLTNTSSKPASAFAERNDLSEDRRPYYTEDAGLFLLSTLSDSIPMFPEEDLTREMNELTIEERDIILTDLFADERQSEQQAKRVKRVEQDNCPTDVDESLKQMQEAVEEIPLRDKVAYLEAKLQASEAEFSRHRMILFLHRENMNPKLAALRLIKYWKERKATFGPDMFLLPMTLKGALRDDHAALKVGFMQLLPRLDTSGRQLLSIYASKHTLEGYTRESMARAVWYIYETILEHPNADKGCVVLNWTKDISLWNFDPFLFPRIVQVLLGIFPITIRATHACGMTSLLINFCKPWLDTLRDKNTRMREVIHSEEGEELLSALAQYGIREEVVPVEMGGKYKFDYSEWLADRLAQGK